MAFDVLKARQAEMWSSAPFELVADTAADIHEDLLDRLAVRPGERVLDLATGTGAVAVRAARRGAVVTGQDLAPGLIETARRLAADAGVDVEFEVGDCERLPYEDASFDVVCSAQGAVFAPDHQAVAAELGRVCRPGGRVGLTAWRPGGSIEGFFGVLAQFQPPPPDGAGRPLDWGRRDYVTTLLGDTFDLEFTEGESPQLGDSPEDVWTLFVTGFGPIKSLAGSLDDDRRRQLRDAFLDFYSDYTDDAGRVSAPREYLVIIGRRR